MTRKAKTYFIVIGLALILLIGLPVWFILGPPRSLVISPETTHLTKPLTADGQVDYVQATINRQREGVTPANNAAVLLVQAMWTEFIAEEDLQLVCDELGIEPPAAAAYATQEESDGFEEAITAWASEKWGVDLSDQDQYDFWPSLYVLDAGHSPWRRDQIPPLAKWVDDQQRCFDLLHQIEDRDHYYCPSPQLLARESSLLSTSHADAMTLLQASYVLATRAMMYVGEGESRRAWEDLRLIFRISRLPCAGYSIQYSLMANSCEEAAADGLKRLLSSGQCDRPLLDEIDLFLAQLPPAAPLSNVLDGPQRWEYLDFTTPLPMVELEEKLYIESDAAVGPIDLLQLPLDKNALLRRLNQRFDELVAITQIEDPQQYRIASGSFQTDIVGAMTEWNQWGPIAAATINQSVRGVYAADLITRWTFDAMPPARAMQLRAQAEERLLRIAVALEKERLTSGDYPTSLDPLTAFIPESLLEDPYAAGQRLRYERRGDGYLLYSLYENGIDDLGTSDDFQIKDGEWIDDEAFELWLDSDLVIRFPAPQLRLEKPKTRGEDFDLPPGETMMEVDDI